jgi:cobalt-zinc-cadmium efflux system protein
MMSHDDDHGATSSGTILGIAVALTLGFALVEALAGWWSGSLALVSDAGHMLTDGGALALAAFAAWLARRSPSHRHTYGFARAEILAGFLNALFMLAVIAAIAVGAIERLRSPGPIVGEVVTIVALVGLLINLAVAWVLSRGARNLNTRGALLHVLGDLLGSFAALIAGVVVTYTGWTPIDPILSIAIAGLILASSVRLLREALHALMEGAPLHLSVEEIGRALAAQPGVKAVHDLHLWTISSDEIALTAHVVVADLRQWEALLASMDSLLARYGITHFTVQPEPEARTVRWQRAPLAHPPRGEE